MRYLLAFALALTVQEPPVVPVPSPKPSVEPIVKVPQDPPAKPVETAIAKKDSLRVELALEGFFEPAEKTAIQLKFEAFAGELAVIKAVAHGARVKKDDVLLQLDGAKMKEAIEAAELNLISARTQFDRTAEDLKMSEAGDGIQLDRLDRQARETADQLKYYVDVESALLLKEGELSVAWTEDSVSDQKEELDQLEKMYKSEELTAATADIVVKRARRSLERARTRLDLAKARFERLKAHTIPTSTDNYKLAARDAAYQLESFRKFNAHNRQEKTTATQRARVGLKQAEETAAKLRREEQNLTILAPGDGIVWHGQFEQGAWQVNEDALKAGEKVRPGATLLTFVPDRLRVRSWIPESRLADFAPGAPTQVSALAWPDLALTGRTDAVALAGARRGDAFDFTVDLATQDPRLVPGLKATLLVLSAELKDVVVIPSSAIAVEGAKRVVRVTVGGKATPRDVTVGRSNGQMTEIKAGLKEGEEVLLK